MINVIYYSKPTNKTYTAPNLIMGKVYRCVEVPQSKIHNIYYYLDKILIGVNYKNIFGIWLNTKDSGVLSELTDSFNEFKFEEFNCELLEVV